MEATERQNLLAAATPRPWRKPFAMEADEFSGTYVVIPLTNDEDGDEIAMFGGTDADHSLIVLAVNEYEALLALEVAAREGTDDDCDCETCAPIKAALARLQAVRSEPSPPASVPSPPEPCDQCGVAPHAPHRVGCFYLTGDPDDLVDAEQSSPGQAG